MSTFQKLSCLAKKYLNMQATSASAERMFSTRGHIFSVKMRKKAINTLRTYNLFNYNLVF